MTALAAVVIPARTGACAADELYGAPPADLKEHLDRLVKSYPDWITGYDNNVLVLKNGTKFPISDGRRDKTFEELLEKPDIDDMFFANYPRGTDPKQPARNFDPGRVRFGPLFDAMYGDCKKNEVAKKLRTINWLPKHNGGKVTITTVNGVDKALEAVSNELDELPNEFIKYLEPTAGTYNCRTVAGSNVRSAHAYAAAIDLNTKYSNYWRWSSTSDKEPKWQNRLPVEIIRIFEKNGFIWGGHWYHYDTMHFEFRPELL
jgi:hypothetical protein